VRATQIKRLKRYVRFTIKTIKEARRRAEKMPGGFYGSHGTCSAFQRTLSFLSAGLQMQHCLLKRNGD